MTTQTTSQTPAIQPMRWDSQSQEWVKALPIYKMNGQQSPCTTCQSISPCIHTDQSGAQV